MALILNIETATETCSVALALNGEVISFKEQTGAKIHAPKLNLFIDDIIMEAGYGYNSLDAISVSKGPGSYTGLRIGVSAAKGLCFALDRPLLSVDTLLSFSTYFKEYYLPNLLDNNPTRNILLCPMLDARRMEVYMAVYNLKMDAIKPASAYILQPDSFIEYLATHLMFFFGSGATKLQHLTHTNSAVFVNSCETSSKGMVQWSEEFYQSGIFEDVAYFEPLYLKDFISGRSK